MSHAGHAGHSHSHSHSEGGEGHSFEMKCGIVIAIFAACMSISELFAGKYGDEEIMKTNEKSAAYQWYQSKGIKQNLIEGQKDLLQSLIDHGAIASSAHEGVKAHIEKLEHKTHKYEKEKEEILEGSAKVGKENWVQEVEGELGKVIGAKEIEHRIEKLGEVREHFDIAILFYQICLVIGAVSLVMKSRKLQYLFFAVMSGLGVLGVGFSVSALLLL